MSSSDINYRSINEGNPFRNLEGTELDTPNDNEDTPRSSGVMIHIVPETSKARWNHIEDLDSFFTRMYTYHQKHGFTVIMLDEAFQLFEFVFVVWLITFFIHCINHPVLFGDTQKQNYTKVTLNDVVIPMGQCIDNFGALTYLILFLGVFYFTIRLIKAIYVIAQYSDIKKFYNSALHIDDDELDNITWHDIKKKIREVQAEQHMCIDKEHLTDLDIYHRILRFKNYMVALMNKNLLPVKYQLPLIGEVVSLSRGLMLNIDIILFRGPGSPFQNNWQLRDDYTVRSNQAELARRLSNLIVIVALVNLLLAPIIFIWQLIYFAFSYANVLKKEPGALGMRTWSNYGRLHLRHFNELDHELDARLNRAYEYADRYLSSFSSPLMTLISKNILFISGGILVLILALGIYEEFVFQVEHVLTIITVLSAIGLICRSLIPDENLIWCPEQLMTAVLAHVHYLPSEWKTEAHTTKVRKEFGNFFQFKAGYLLNELFSPIVTPFVLIFVFRPKSLEIVKFFRSFTVTVRGVGNVCSFAQMDVRKHGNPEWQIKTNIPSLVPVLATANIDEEKKSIHPVEDGKTELSLVRFTLTNPEWQMPSEAMSFIKGLRENARMDLMKAKHPALAAPTNPLADSLVSFGAMGEEYSSIATSVLVANNISNTNILASSQYHSPSQNVMENSQTMKLVQGSNFEQMLQQNLGEHSQGSSSDDIINNSQNMITSLSGLENMRKLRVGKTEGSLAGPTDSLLYSLSGVDPKLAKNPAEITVADMCLSTLYLHELHKRNTKQKSFSATEAVSVPGSSNRRKQTIITSKPAENTPLLSNIRS